MQTWIVLVEASHNGAGGTIEHEELGALLAALDCGGRARALHSPDRYALQVSTSGSDPAEALDSVLSRWSDALRELALPRWEIVRTEVLRPAELKRDLRTVDAVAWQSPLGSPPDGTA
ncbi:MAG: hypothetical protein M3144_10860 [Actinomycetota bacterium]|nr:hypothetical protein [Actinomycetota bacterium]